MNQQVRIKGEDSDFINQLRHQDEVIELAKELGVVDEDRDKITWEEYFLLIIPPDAEPIERPEDEMRWKDVGEAKDNLIDLAGENVAIHEVVTVFTERFTEKFSIEVSDE